MSEVSPENEFLGDVTNSASNGSEPPPDFANSRFGVEEPTPESESAPPFEEPIKGDGTCAVCGAPTFRPPGLTKAGRRKRIPKYCDLHTRNVRVQEEPPDPVRLESQLRQIQQELADQLKLAGILTGPLFPVTGYYIQDNADMFVTALLQTTRDKERLLKILYRAAKVAPIYRLLEFGAGVGVSMQVDQKKHDPHSTFARHLGVERSYEAIYGSTNSAFAGNTNNVSSNVPPHYATVQ